MSRDQRSKDNWAFVYAYNTALERKLPLEVIFCLSEKFLNASSAHYGFMIEGLSETRAEFSKLNVPFVVLTGDPAKKIPQYLRKIKTACLICDFDPLKIKIKWKNAVAASRYLNCPFYEVDAHNIVPCWLASPKQEFGAYTLRPKISKLLRQYLDKYPALKPYPYNSHKNRGADDRNRIKKIFGLSAGGIFKPGSRAARAVLEDFIENKLRFYAAGKNDPNRDVLSGLSMYLHFGHISSQTAALRFIENKISGQSAEAFLEELIVRKELSDNFCFYNRDYDSFKGLPDWAKKTLNAHGKDTREYKYSLRRFENASTHDKLWNAAQAHMVKRGKMHGYMRMYWAKKILEWTLRPEDAVDYAVYLNDKYELDGRDPNGYAGILWAIGGLHDRAWPKRPVYGNIRYMNYAGCKRKFDVKKYISEMEKL